MYDLAETPKTWSAVRTTTCMKSPSPGDRPKTTLNAFDIACVVIGGIIGIGIFFTPKEVAKVVDST